MNGFAQLGAETLHSLSDFSKALLPSMAAATAAMGSATAAAARCAATAFLWTCSLPRRTGWYCPCCSCAWLSGWRRRPGGGRLSQGGHRRAEMAVHRRPDSAGPGLYRLSGGDRGCGGHGGCGGHPGGQDHHQHSPASGGSVSSRDAWPGPWWPAGCCAAAWGCSGSWPWRPSALRRCCAWGSSTCC